MVWKMRRAGIFPANLKNKCMTQTAEVPHLDDLIFERRNQSYGAYQLRKTYERHVNTAVAVAIALSLLLVSLPAILRVLQGPEVAKGVPTRKEPSIPLGPPPLIDRIIPPVIPVSPLPQKVIKLLPPKVTQDDVLPEEAMPTLADTRETVTSHEAMGGTEVVFEPPTDQVIVPDVVAEPVYITVEQMPYFPGGTDELMKFLRKNVKYPPLALRMGVEGTVYVGFIVSKAGRIDEIRVVKGIGKECDEEAVRVIGSMPDWNAGK